jgi:hypothetical protein
MSRDIGATMSFRTLINAYIKLQSRVMSMVRYLSSLLSEATPGRFMLLQWMMGLAGQLGQTISNLIAQVQAMIANAVRNQRGG